MTAIADGTQPVGPILSAASGLARWEEETSHAGVELATAAAALCNIQADISALQCMIAADHELAGSRQKAQALEQQVRALQG